MIMSVKGVSVWITAIVGVDAGSSEPFSTHRAAIASSSSLPLYPA